MITNVDVAGRFGLGQIVATPGALSVLVQAAVNPASLVDRHVSGDWGELSAGDKQQNDNALNDGARILSAYHIGTQKVYVITEAADDDGQRCATTILLPEDY